MMHYDFEHCSAVRLLSEMRPKMNSPFVTAEAEQA
jgi:hypothetical protein